MNSSRISSNQNGKANCNGTPDRDSADGGDTAKMRAMAVRLVRAVDTLGRLPRTADTRPAGTRSAWPEMIRESRVAIAATRSVSGARPSPAAIDDLDRLARHRALLWARACGVRWAELCHRHRRSRTTLNRDHRRALAALVTEELTGPDQKSA